MKENNVIDGGASHESPQLCGNAVLGSDSGHCPGCQRRKALMLSGLCGTCATKRGIHPFSTKADLAATCPDNNKQE
jgi:hypothetical protein